MVNFGPLMASLGHPCKFQRVSCLGSVIVRNSSSGHQPNLAVLNRGRHLYSAGRPSRWALPHILVIIIVCLLCTEICCFFAYLCRCPGSSH